MIVGDIGGTNIRFAIASSDRNGLPNLEHVWSSPSKHYDAFGDALEHFLTIASPNKNPLQGVFALAGPVDKNTVKLTNNSWTVKRDDLISRFGFERLVFMNDFAAMARSIPELPSKAFKVLQTGDASCVLSGKHTTAVAGAGTGLGQALLMRDAANKWAVMPTEGGHQPYSPMDKLEIEIHKLLQSKLKYVSFEDICSGQGLENVYEALLKINGLENKILDAKSITEEASCVSLV
jgi:glucokinase